MKNGLHPQVNGGTAELVQAKLLYNNILCLIQLQCTPALSHRERELLWPLRLIPDGAGFRLRLAKILGLPSI
jgi:hypothetical protein